MGEIRTDAAIFEALGRQMTRAVQRQAVAAGNLANLDTPGYRTREVRFADTLAEQLQPPMAQSHPGHFNLGSMPGSGSVAEAEGLAGRRDANNVQLDRELLAITRANGDFNAAQTVLAAKFRLVRYAINAGH